MQHPSPLSRVVHVEQVGMLLMRGLLQRHRELRRECAILEPAPPRVAPGQPGIRTPLGGVGGMRLNHLNASEQTRVTLVGQQRDRRRVAELAHRDPQVEQSGTAADDELAAGGVTRAQSAAGVRSQLERPGVEVKAPRLRVVDGWRPTGLLDDPLGIGGRQRPAECGCRGHGRASFGAATPCAQGPRRLRSTTESKVPPEEVRLGLGSKVVRIVSPQALVRHLQTLPAETPRVVIGGNHAVPWQLVEAAESSWERYRLFMLNAPAGLPDRPGVVLETPFVGAGMRGRGGLAYYPCRLSLVPALLLRRTVPDVVMVHVAPPRDGLVSLGVEVNILPAAIEAARAAGGIVVAQVNPKMPYTYGDAVLHVDEVDFGLESDAPLGEVHRTEPGDVQKVIGDNVARLIADGATLQLGIGAIPDATLQALHNRRELKVWSEMISDGVMKLDRAGALAKDIITTSFAFGSSELYDWLDGNRRIVFCRTERTNDRALIARQAAMTSVN